MHQTAESSIPASLTVKIPEHRLSLCNTREGRTSLVDRSEMVLFHEFRGNRHKAVDQVCLYNFTAKKSLNFTTSTRVKVSIFFYHCGLYRFGAT